MVMNKTSAYRSAVESIDLYCRKTNGRALKRLGSCLGASAGRNKTEGRTGIVDQARKLENLRSQRHFNGEVSITSIDVGVSNFAYSVFKWYKGDKLPTLVDWDKINLPQRFLEDNRTKMTMNPLDTWKVGYGLVEMLTKELEVSDLYTIENQRLRSVSSKNIVNSVILSNLVEHILYSNLKNKRIYGKIDKNYIVHSSNPQRMAQYWCDLKSLKTLYNRYKEALGIKKITKPSLNNLSDSQSSKVSKTIRINLVRTILKNAITCDDYQKCQLAPGWRSKVEDQLNTGNKLRLHNCVGLDVEVGAKKDDDLADSFLHGLAWMHWLNTYEGIADLLAQNGRSFNEDVLEQFNKYCMSLNVEWTLMSPKMKGELAELKFDETLLGSVKN